MGAELEEMSRIVAQMKSSVDDAEQFRDLDLQFHLAMGAAAKNNVLNDLIKSVRERMMELITKSLLLHEGREQAVKQHKKILEAVRTGSPVKAREAVRLHLASFQRGYKVLLDKNERDHSA